MAAVIFVLALLAAAGWWQLRPPPPPTPRAQVLETLRAFNRWSGRGDAPRACALLTVAARRRLAQQVRGLPGYDCATLVRLDADLRSRSAGRVRVDTRLRGARVRIRGRRAWVSIPSRTWTSHLQLVQVREGKWLIDRLY